MLVPRRVPIFDGRNGRKVQLGYLVKNWCLKVLVTLSKRLNCNCLRNKKKDLIGDDLGNSSDNPSTLT